MTTADIMPHPDGTGWFVVWETERMTQPNLWLYATREEAEQVAATFRGENVMPLPAPPEPEAEPAPPSAPTVIDLFITARETGLADVLFPVDQGDEAPAPAHRPVDDWDIAKLDAECAAEQARQDAERATKLAGLVNVGGVGLIRPYRKRRRRAPAAEPGEGVQLREHTAAFYREVNRLHVTGVLTRAETRQLLGLDPNVASDADPWWRRLGRSA